uniref:C2H2-type domain-containing protein n=1 Tax=Periophthalmus magnuspinnatus TaxID=409849 RepID=A0A3B4B4H8_9GOBI
MLGINNFTIQETVVLLHTSVSVVFSFLKCKRSTVSRSADDFYYDGDEQYYSENDDDDDVSENSCNTSLPSSVAQFKEIKTEASDEEEELIDSSKSQAKGPSCPICVDRHFRGINKLVRHMRSHTQQKPYCCPVCSVTFSQTYHLLRHMRKQHDAGEHVCSLCGITLGSELIQTDLKNPHCPLCLHSLQTHTKEKPFTCSLCTMTFSQGYHMTRHMKVQHGAGMFVCPRCGEDLASAAELQNHKRMHPPDPVLKIKVQNTRRSTESLYLCYQFRKFCPKFRGNLPESAYLSDSLTFV